MNIREKFLNYKVTNLVNSMNYIEDTFNDDSEIMFNKIVEKINNIKKRMLEQKNDDSSFINLTEKELDKIISLYEINNKEEDRLLIKEIINQCNYYTESKDPLSLRKNLLIINEMIVEDFMEQSNSKNVLRELTQLLCLIKMDKEVSIKDMITANNMPLDYTDNFKKFILLEDKITNKIKKSMSFNDLIDYLNELEEGCNILDKGKQIYEKIVYEIASIVLKMPQEDNLIEFKKDKICFNMYSLDMYERSELNDSKKRELIQALKLIIEKNEEEANKYSSSIFKQQEKIISMLERNVSEEDINNAIDKLPKNKRSISSKVKDIIITVLKVNEKDKFLMFEKEQLNMLNIERIREPIFKKEQIISYFMIMAYKENENIQCKLLNNNTIFFHQFKDMFFIEDILKKQLTQYTLTDILEVIHEFKKDKIFTKENELIIDNIISNNFVQKFSHNQINQDIMYMNDSHCVFNEKLMNKIDAMNNHALLELYLFSQKQLVEELSKNISVDKTIENIQKYKKIIEDKLKYQITESDILNTIEKIEYKSNTLIQSKSKIYQSVSIILEAKETNNISNEIVEIGLQNGKWTVFIFNETICDKLVQKDLTEASMREFCQALLIYELKSKNVTIKNIQGENCTIHDNFEKIDNYVDKIREKILNKIPEEKIDNIINNFTNQLSDETKEDMATSIMIIKKRIGIKGKSIFKNRL